MMPRPYLTTRLDLLRAILGLPPTRPLKFRGYDDIQASARMVTWLCCRRTVWSTHPEKGCSHCGFHPNPWP